jgi:hypothetical protein
MLENEIQNTSVSISKTTETIAEHKHTALAHKRKDSTKNNLDHSNISTEINRAIKTTGT